MSGCKYPHVFTPIVIRGVLFKNRLVQAPPGALNGADENGFCTDKLVRSFKQFARGGIAVCTVGNCSIDHYEACDEPQQLVLSDPACVLKLRPFARMCESFGCHGSLELTHPGMFCLSTMSGHPAYSVSSFVSPPERNKAETLGADPVPTIEMSRAHIKATIEKFARAASFCKQAGMKMCMIHGAHGNLPAQFASPYYNKRTDEYGGCLENRARFTVELLDAVRAAVGENFVIEYRISAEEFAPYGMHFDETLRFIGLIRDKIDILHVSAGIHDVVGDRQYMRYLYQNYTMDQMYNVHFAADIKKKFPDLIVTTVGSIKNVAMAEEILAGGKADFVAMMRPLHADFEMARKFAEGREWEHTPCLRCACGNSRSRDNMCSVNPMWGKYEEYPDGVLPPSPKKKKVAVIGAGPGGIEAVKWLLQRGHDVTLYEKSDKVGGTIRKAVSAPFKKDLRDYLAYMEGYVQHTAARVLLNTEATPELIEAEGYDAVYLAIGADPVMLRVPGSDRPNVFWAPEAESGNAPCGENVVIIGASTVGTEASINLGMQGKRVTVLDVAPKVSLMASGAQDDLLNLSEQYGVKRMLGRRLVEIKDGCVVAENAATGEAETYPADTVLMAVGMKPKHDEAISFCHCCPETNFFMIGDCANSGDIRDAVRSAFDAARHL